MHHMASGHDDDDDDNDNDNDDDEDNDNDDDNDGGDDDSTMARPQGGVNMFNMAVAWMIGAEKMTILK